MTQVLIYKRITLRCWKCKETYSHYEEVDAEKKLKTSCPYCREEAIVDFSPFRNEKKVVLRHSGMSEKVIVIEYNLPDVLSTSKF